VASTTVGGLARRFTPDRVAGIEAGDATSSPGGWTLLPEPRRTAVLADQVCIDLDAADVVVYGRHKQGVDYNYQGQRCGRPHLATWAGTGLTLAADQLTLALDGHLDHLWATSFIVRNLPTGGAGFDTATDVEAWFRMRTDIEDRIREAKLDAGLNHLPSGYAESNTVWTWAALIAGNLPHPAASDQRHRHRPPRPRPRRPPPPPAAAGTSTGHPPRQHPHPATTPRPRPAAPRDGHPAGPARRRLNNPIHQPPRPRTWHPPTQRRHPATPTPRHSTQPAPTTKTSEPPQPYSRIQV
jgi:hypothetical protein